MSSPGSKRVSFGSTPSLHLDLEFAGGCAESEKISQRVKTPLPSKSDVFAEGQDDQGDEETAGENPGHPKHPSNKDSLGGVQNESVGEELPSRIGCRSMRAPSRGPSPKRLQN